MPAPHHSGETNQRLYMLVGLALFLGSAAVLVSAAHVIGWFDEVTHPTWSQLAAYVGLVVVAELVRVHVRVRSTSSITRADAVILVGLIMLPSPWWCSPPPWASQWASGPTLPTSPRRSEQPKSPSLLFIGGLVLNTWGPGDSTTHGFHHGRFLAMTIVDMVPAVPVIATASTRIRDRPPTTGTSSCSPAGAVRCGGSGDHGVGPQPRSCNAVADPDPAPRTSNGCGPGRAKSVATPDQCHRVVHRVDLEAVLRAAVTSGAKLFSADEIEVEIWLDDRSRLVRGDASAISFDGDPAQAPSQPSSVYAVALQGYRGQRDIGALRLRFRHKIKISDREQAMLQTYAAALDTAVRNAAAYGRLGEATAAHAHAAAHDPLTGLANRRELERCLTTLVNAVEGPPALLLIDVKHFKEVNDALGHLAGDQLLVAVAQRLTAAAGADDLVCRFGGDEFAVVLPAPGTSEEIASRVRRLLDNLADPVEVEGVPLSIEVYAGLARLDPSDQRPDGTELMRRADVAMYQSKRTGQSPFYYDGVRDPRDRDRLELSGQLARAVSEGEFELFFQPIVDLATGAVVAAEALARWHHPTRGLLSPQHFLGLLERSSHLTAFTESILHEALAAADMWRAAGHT